ncbi:MAG: hypothetical protein AABY22_32210 [Nanoarchaeota archaeon]
MEKKLKKFNSPKLLDLWVEEKERPRPKKTEKEKRRAEREKELVEQGYNIY